MVTRLLLLNLLWIGLLVSSCSSEHESSGDPCAGDVFENSVPASKWAQANSPVKTYHYSAHPAAGHADIKLLGAANKLLATMSVSQRYGDPELADGSMEAILDRDGPAPLRLLTRGHEINADGYQVHMQLIDGQRSLHIVADFQNESCAPAAAQNNAAPACAANLPLAHTAFTLPSCGLIADERLLAGKPPTLRTLSYEVDALTQPPSVGGASNGPDGQRWTFQVLDSSGPGLASDIETWLQEVGFDDLIGSERERMLTTAYLDRTWWRTMEQQLAFCAELPADTSLSATSQPLQQDLSTRRQAICPGQHNSSDWGKHSNSGNSRGAGAWGDPHLTTFDHHAFDFQGAGEYVLVESVHSEPLMVQIRMEPGVAQAPIPACANVTYATAIATEIAGHKVMVEVRPDWILTIDGKPISDISEIPQLSGGAKIHFDQKLLTIQWPDQSVLKVTAKPGKTLTVTMDLPASRKGLVRGLLGNFNGNPNDDRALPDGTTLAIPLSFQQNYNTFGAAWLITEQSSLFTYPAGKSTLDYQIANFPDSPARLEDIPLAMRHVAEQACKDGDVSDPERLNNCILDTVCAEGNDFIADAAAAPAPRSAESNAGDVATTGDIRSIPVPDVVESQTPSEDPTTARCVQPAPRNILLTRETKNLTPPAQLNVNAASPKVYASTSDLENTTIPANTRVQSYLVFRHQAPEQAGPLIGSVRFSAPILGIIVDLDQDHDTLLGATDSTYVSSSFNAFMQENDRFEISADQHELNIKWSHHKASRFRVLTAIPTEGN